MRAIVRMKRLGISAAMAALLTGCGGVNTSVVYRCPGGIAAYSPERQQRAAEELAKLPGDSAVAEMIDDYGELRARCRAMVK